ncbi:MAG: 2-C-methyl-D-erythritol 4-phosphate cytidylyltransferase [Planctomycetaceae bacterium]|jgi:2-C-methyl-D-erythritol 4-phosphate cytidylyltransferase|nr:2-C-methyl-D-erythritol 4-phosphate cytidylyltransferase [Planctomycetaceae bacterium]
MSELKESTMTYAVIIAAAGQSRRFSNNTSNDTTLGQTEWFGDNAVKKPYVKLLGKPIWLYSTEKFARRMDVKQIILVVAPEDVSWFRDYFAVEIDKLLLMVISGGSERVDSVQKALNIVRNNIDYVVVHDAARPCVTDVQINEVFKSAKQHGAAILATPIVGTIKLIEDGIIKSTILRTGMWEAQTPQVFRRQILIDSYSKRNITDKIPTDDAELVEQAGFNVSIVPTDKSNLKITTQSDLKFAEAILANKK